MGCCLGGNVEPKKTSNVPTGRTELVKLKDKDISVLTPKGLLDDDDTVLEFSTKKNDIMPYSREKLLMKADKVSRNAVEKLALRNGEKSKKPDSPSDPASAEQ